MSITHAVIRATLTYKAADLYPSAAYGAPSGRARPGQRHTLRAEAKQWCALATGGAPLGAGESVRTGPDP